MFYRVNDFKFFIKISFNVTHTHNSSSFCDDLMRAEFMQVYAEEIMPPFHGPENMVWGDKAKNFLVEKLVSLIVSAICYIYIYKKIIKHIPDNV